MIKLLPLALLGTVLCAGNAMADTDRALDDTALVPLTTTELDGIDGGFSFAYANAGAGAQSVGLFAASATNTQTVTLTLPFFAGSASRSTSGSISFP